MGRNRHPAKRQSDLVKEATLYLRGYSLWDISQEVGVTTTQVSLDIKTIRKQWQEHYLRDFNQWVNEQLAKLDHVEIEAWKAWEESKEQVVKTSTKEKEIEINDGETTIPGLGRETAVTEEQRYGDPRYLEIIGRTIERRCKILGIEAPQKHLVGIGRANETELLDPTQRIQALVALIKYIGGDVEQQDSGGNGSMGSD